MASIAPLLQQRRFSEARPLLETLLLLEPEHPEALYNLGVLASEEGKSEEARLLLRRAVVAKASDAHAQANAQVAWRWPRCGWATRQKPARPWRRRSSWSPRWVAATGSRGCRQADQA